jgi:cytoskeletal protein RodZ
MSQSFGASLREARERKGVSLRQISAATKISVAALESLEKDDFSKLPGGIFSRSFVRSYAIEVGLDPDKTVQRFLLEYEGEPADHDGAGHESGTPVHEPALPAPPPRRAASDLRPEFEFESKQRIASVVLRLVVMSVPVAAAIIYFSSRGVAPASESAQPLEPRQPVAQEPATPRQTPSVAADSTERSANAGDSTGVRPAREGTPLSTVTPVKAVEPAAPRASLPDVVTIELAPSGDCWAQLTADGVVVISRVLKPGERESRAFRDSALLQVGDAAACAILINGQPARPLGPAKKVRQIRITRENYTALLP